MGVFEQMKFRKRPVIIEATQWLDFGDHPEVVRSAQVGICKHCKVIMQSHGWIDTLEGGHIVCPFDWIITGVKGEHYPCKPDIFEATYEPA